MKLIIVLILTTFFHHQPILAWPVPISINAYTELRMTNKEKIVHGEVIVTLSQLEDKVLGVTGQIFIGCAAKDVWRVLTDYSQLSRFVPKILQSKLLQDNGNEKIIQQIGRSGISIFQKTARVKLKISEEYLQRIKFDNLSGDFKVYKGEWLLEYDHEANGTVLTYNAEIKPRFYAPQAFIRYVQKNDLPQILRAIRKRVRQVKKL